METKTAHTSAAVLSIALLKTFILVSPNTKSIAITSGS
jgi:hypothetical protein